MNMNYLTSTMELTRTNPAHIGTAPLSGTQSKKLSETAQSKNKSQFENFLLSAIEEMNSQQVDNSRLAEKLLTNPDEVDIQDVTIAMSKAQMSLSLAQTVIDRLISGWNELSTPR